MSPTTWTLLITTLSTGTIITMASHHWLLAWLGLELNTLSMLPIISTPHHPRATEAATKYFLIQITAATLLLFAGTWNAWTSGEWAITNNTNHVAMTMMTMAIMAKLALAPVHAWYPEVIQGSTMTTALIISTWQKLAPMTFLLLTTNHLPTNLMLMCGLISTLLGGWTGLNQTQTRKIMALSSIAHMGWLLIATTIDPALATLTLITYMIMTTSMFLTLNQMNTKTLVDLPTAPSHSQTLQITAVITLMSLGGLPPLTGFIPKWLILKELTTYDLLALSILLILASLPSLFFYIRMAYIATLTAAPTTTHNKHKWRFKSNLNPTLTMTLPLTIMALPLTPVLYTN
uniref:NADH-ubiquinone oxidoreductase chain 2 n=1 Tax=Tarentola mauritanica TaxID=8569 RepID=A0A411LAS5_TARMA|nr:NADH dehydrogenase subunit 2 [Tarentola mauritanica]